MRVGITGPAGFVATRFLARMADGRRGIEAVPLHADVTKPSDIATALKLAAPDVVLHLAARSNVMDAWRDPAVTFTTNAGGTSSLCKALAEISFHGRVLIVSSADAYGAVAPSALPIQESHALAPGNPYAASKQAAEAAALQWHRSHGLRVVIARSFNHSGPGQLPAFVVPSLARQVVRVQQGLQPHVLVGNLNVTRDLSWVDDVVDSYADLLDVGKAGEVYNVCSGQEQNLRDILDRLVMISGQAVEVVVDPQRMRPNDQARSVGDPTRLRQLTGRCPAALSDDHLAQLLSYWRHANLSD